MTENPQQPSRPIDGQGFEILGQHDRIGYKLMDEQQEVTAELRAALIAELEDWRKDHPSPRDPGKPFPLKATAEKVGVSPSTLTEVIRGTYKADDTEVFRKIDQMLADERQRAGRMDFRQHAKILLTHKIFGTLNAAVKFNKMAAVVGPPGCGKTAHALAYQRERSGVIYVRCKKRRGGFTDIDCALLLCDTIQELRPMKSRTQRQRVDSIESWLRKRRNTVILVDEAQFLDPAGLEFFRTLHDVADPAGHHGLPIVFFGDEQFRKAIVAVRQGEKSPIAPQLSRRMVLVFDIAKQGAIPGTDGDVYTIEDILKIVRNDRVKLITPAAARWLTKHANTPESGMLGGAIDVLKIAVDLAEKRGDPRVDVAHLQAAFQMSNGPDLAEAIDQAAGGELLRKVG